MTVLYENLPAGQNGAARQFVAAVVWSVGWFYWAYVLNSGGTRPRPW